MWRSYVRSSMPMTLNGRRLKLPSSHAQRCTALVLPQNFIVGLNQPEQYTMCIPYTRGSARFGARYRCIGRGKPTHLSTTLRMYRMDSNHRPARLSPHSSIQLSYRTYCFSHVDWTRTSDWHIISLLLYQLSYYACFLHVNWGRTNTIGL